MLSSRPPERHLAISPMIGEMDLDPLLMRSFGNKGPSEEEEMEQIALMEV